MSEYTESHRECSDNKESFCYRFKFYLVINEQNNNVNVEIMSDTYQPHYEGISCRRNIGVCKSPLYCVCVRIYSCILVTIGDRANIRGVNNS